MYAASKKRILFRGGVKLLKAVEKKQQEEVKGAPKGPSKEYESIEFSDVAFFRLGYFGY